MFRYMNRVVVPREKLIRALIIWLRLMPKHVWRQYGAYEHKAAKKGPPEDDLKLRQEIAQYLAGRFDVANWEITQSGLSTGEAPTSGGRLSTEDLAETSGAFACETPLARP
jgi:hypothetical protein